MTDNAMAERNKCNQKQYIARQTMEWLREKSVIRNSTWYQRQWNGSEKKSVIRNSTWYDKQRNG